MPTTELLAPIGRALFPAFVRLADDPPALRKAFRLALGVQALIALPAGIGLALVADSAVPLLLGPQWTVAIPLLQTLALVNVATALAHCGNYLLLALGRVKTLACFAWAQFIVLATLIGVFFPSAAAKDITDLRLMVASATVVGFLAIVVHTVPPLRWRDVLDGIFRPALATGFMVAALRFLPLGLESIESLALRLSAQIMCGATAYAASLILLRCLTGQWSNAEQYLLDKMFPSQASRTNITFHPTPADLPALARELMARAAHSQLEASPEWFDLLQRTVFQNDPNIRYGVAWREGRPVAVLPIIQETRFPIRRLTALANFYTPVFAPAIDKSATAYELADLLRLAVSQFRPLHEIRFSPMDPHSPSYPLLIEALKIAGWPPFRYFCFGNWHHIVDNDWPTYFAARPGKVRNTVRRKDAQFSAAGGELEIVQTGASLEPAIQAFVEIYAASWKPNEPFPEFMPELIRLLAQMGSLRLGIARLNGRPIAAQVWAVQGSVASIIKLAHREDSIDHAAGTLLTTRLLEHVMATDGVREVDYLIGDDPYKQNWMSTRRERWGLIAYNPRTVIGVLLLLVESGKRAIKKLNAAITDRISRPSSIP